MKQRIISACAGLVVLFAVLAFFETMVLNAAVALIVMVAIGELLHAVGCTKNKLLTALSCLYGGSIPFIPHGMALKIFPIVTFCYIALLLLLMIARHNELTALQIGFTFFVSLLIPFALTVAVYLRDRQGSLTALYLIMLALAGAWMSDTGAYFVGRAFGRHKLAPQISPKKTVEGAVGGIVVCVAFMLVFSLAYQWGCASLLGAEVWVNYPALLLLTPVISVSGILGDLSASVIKRQNGIKDYGNIMPGHGGVMDRFDSVFFTAPTMFMLAQLVTFIRVL